MKEKKYKLTDECITFNGKQLYRIEALKDFSYLHKGDKGGFVESEKNLSHLNDCWVFGNAKVYDNAMICRNARVFGNAEVYGNAKVYGNAVVCDEAKVYGLAEVYGNADVSHEAEVYGNADVYGYARVYRNARVASISDYIVFKNWWSSGRYFTWTRSNNMWSVGCFYGTGEELIEKSYEDSKLSGKEYERVVKYVESIIKEN